MAHRGALLALTAATALTVAGCAAEDADGSAACAAPELRWSVDAASAGDLVTLHGENLLSGCDDGQGETVEPLSVTGVALLADGELAAPPPAIDGGTLTASEAGDLDFQVALPPDLPAGTEVRAEVTVTSGPALTSDALAIDG
ncbi:hypothetical protein BCE75_11659 [Isoptericola sp. CG 20/1183]|uniref:Lipoprotein n=1 Tax=Isoptericola halotolerans TaxID=300560 RepID=A0ABX5EIK0_9MICO|nr:MULTISPECIES: hypothetical protein [Isoptericola]PRZ02924.1 hypothetical protein BCE75_11659 [Isoptericola sp. CG 20/1183]PRZ09921.1 hypothetical protein BCL65_10159 [Isoptericola halotolerans]